VTSLGEIVALAVLASVALLVPATIGVLTTRPSRRQDGPLRVPLTATALALVVLAGSALAGVRPVTGAVVAVLLGGSVLAWARAGRHWAVSGLVAWALSVDAGLTYLVYVAWWTLTQGLAPTGLLASGALWLLELFVFVLAVGYMWEFVDVVARRSWPRRIKLAATSDGFRPFVSIHVPTHNEPPDMVIRTLEHLLRLDYDAYEILLVDNNTDDPELWRPVEEFCAGHDAITFLHLENWPGYKSGALNHALTRTDPRAEVIGIVDADYLVRPDFLSRCAPLFGDRDIGFVQTPQDYRDWQQSSYFRRLYHSYDYFFEVSQRSRNERNGAIFGGTMGLIRLSALTEVGGWDEWCITEDAELSLRLLRAGWGGQHVEESFGTGIMPLTFESLKRQRFRWCFGGIQILRMHWRSLMPWDRSPENRLTMSQRWAYLVGGLQWFGDAAGLMFTVFLLAGAVDAAAGDGFVIRRLSGLLLVCVLCLTLLGTLRSIALVRRVGGATWREAAGALGLWLGLGWCVAQASVKGLVAREGAFLRTPKTRGRLSGWDALRGNRVETGLAVLCLAGVVLAWVHPSPGRALVSLLLAVQSAAYAAAPLNSLAAIRADLTPELRRRRQKLPSWSPLTRARGRVVLAPLVTAALVAALLVVAVAPTQGPQAGDFPGRAQGPATGSATPEEEPSRGPSSGPVPASSTSVVERRASATPSQVPASVGPTSRPTATRTAAPTPRPTASATRPTRAATPTRPTRAAAPTRGPSARPTQAATPSPRATGRPPVTRSPTARPTR
jgi:cellulose synthase/poly-beta-1,6-N-acetylglucosamine synthase-like glycosyltransferase